MLFLTTNGWTAKCISGEMNQQPDLIHYNFCICLSDMFIQLKVGISIDGNSAFAVEHCNKNIQIWALLSGFLFLLYIDPLVETNRFMHAIQ